MLLAHPFFEGGKIGKDQNGRKLAFIADHDGFGDQRMVLQGAFNRLRCDELPARGLEQVFLAVGHIKEAVTIDTSDIAGSKPAIDKSRARFFGLVPVAVKNRRAAHQDFPIVGNAHIDVRERLTYAAQAMRLRSVHGNDGRSFSQAVAFVNAYADVRIPFGQGTTEGRASRDEDADPAANPLADLSKHEPV